MNTFRFYLLILFFFLLPSILQAHEKSKEPELPWQSLEELTAFFDEISLSNSKSIRTDWGIVCWKAVSDTSFGSLKSFEGFDSTHRSVAMLTFSEKSASVVFISDHAESSFTVNQSGVFSRHHHFSDFLCVEACCENSSETKSNKEPLRLQAAATSSIPFSDDVIREYRLAIAVGYLATSRIQSDWETFFVNIVRFLNPIYMRDLGIRFVPVLNERLFNRDPELESGKFSKDGRPLNAAAIRSYGTEFINGIVGSENYDVGIVIAPSKDRVGGMAVVGAAYSAHNKANCMSTGDYISTAHELGHLFGADHTFSVGGTQVRMFNRIESGDGTSIMSYGKTITATRDFFNLGNILQIREMYQKNAGYYVNDADKPVADQGINPPKGIVTNNRPPEIDKARYQREYVIPTNTPFRFEVWGNDADSGDELTYQMQQLNYHLWGLTPQQIASNRPFFVNQLNTLGGTPIFEVTTPKVENLFYFQNRFYSRDLTTQIPLSDYNADFFITLFDKNSNKAVTEHKTMIDTMQIKIKALRSLLPFTLDYSPKKEFYRAGEKVRLTWSVDPSVVPPTHKVRIRLSADLGKSYPYILVNETDNDGEEEITIPHLPVGNITYVAYPHRLPFEVAAGVFMIEHVEGICYATSEIRPVEKIKDINIDPFPANENPNNYTRIVGGFTISAGERTENYRLSVTHPLQTTREKMLNYLNAVTIVPEVITDQSFYLLCNEHGVVLLATADKLSVSDRLQENENYRLYGLVSARTLTEIQNDYEGKPITFAFDKMYASAQSDYVTPAISLKIAEEKEAVAVEESVFLEKKEQLYVEQDRLVYKTRALKGSEKILFIFSIDGTMVFRSDFVTYHGVETYRFDIASLARGIYIVKVLSKESSFEEKVIKW